MAAYAALVSVMQIIHQIEHHPFLPSSVDKKQVESLTEIVRYLQEFLEGYKSPFVDGDEADPLEMRIADAVYAAEDVIESHIVDQILPAASAAELYESLVKMTEHMDLIKKKVTVIVTVKYQLRGQVSTSVDSSTSADLYERVNELIEHMNWIKKVVLYIVALKYQPQRLLWASTYLYESLIKVIEEMDFIKKEVMEIIANLRRRGVSEFVGSKRYAYFYWSMMMLTEYMDLTKKKVTEIVAIKDKLRRQVSTSVDSSTSTDLYADRIHESLVKMIEHMDLIKKKVREIVAIKDLLRRQVSTSVDSSTSSDLYERVKKLIELINWIKKEVLDIVALKYQLQRLLSASTYLYESLIKVIEEMDLIKKEVMNIIANLRRQGVSEFVGSKRYAYFYGSMMMLTEYMDLTKKEVMEIIALKDQLQIQIYPSAYLYGNLVNVIKDMDLIKKEVMEHIAVKDQLLRQISLPVGSSTSSLSRLNNITGFDDVAFQLMEKLIYGESGRQVIPIVGMGGIGKTTLATNVYEMPCISQHFDICAWVTISQQNDTKKLLYEILSQADENLKKGLSEMKKDKIGEDLHKCLSYRRYLIVLDDIWSIKVWEELQRYFPDDGHSSRIMVTTRLSNLGSQVKSNYVLEMKFMDEKDSWDLFSKIVFGGERCPSELVNIGTKIVESCGGLPLSIVVTGGLLKKLERTEECWESIRGNINSLVNSEKDKYCLKLLKLSYNHLPIYLKPCFLYFGTFEDSNIRVSTIIKLWVSEGFLKPIRGKSLETVAKMYLDELVNRNLVLIDEFGKTGNMKYLKIHDLLRDLCVREAENERFYHVVGQHSPQGMCSQRRIVIPRSTSEDKVVDVMKSSPHARSYISYHERIQSLPDIKLLRILKAATFGEQYSPEKMLNLRLLDCGDCRELPSLIDLPWSLQTLIDSSGKYNNAPVEIWNMSQLRHVYFYQVQLEHVPDPPSDSIVIMENLQTLKGVSNFKCDEMMAHRIPNIKKLGIVGSIDDMDAPIHNIHHLQKLESLSCEYFYRPNSPQELTFPQSLKSLTLGITGGRMEDLLEKASTLPLLQKLRLSHADFTTGKWETVEGQFPSLKYLSLASCRQLECWTMESSHFPCLEHLSLTMVFLKEIPAELGEIPTLKYVKLDECSESAAKSAKRKVEEQEELHGEDELSFKVEVKLWRRNEELHSLASTNFQVTS